jgi:hypothetical protein
MTYKFYVFITRQQTSIIERYSDRLAYREVENCRLYGVLPTTFFFSRWTWSPSCICLFWTEPVLLVIFNKDDILLSEICEYASYESITRGADTRLGLVVS